jgi:hypothetical protein
VLLVSSNGAVSIDWTVLCTIRLRGRFAPSALWILIRCLYGVSRRPTASAAAGSELPPGRNENMKQGAMNMAKEIFCTLVIAFLLSVYGCETSECPDSASIPSRESLEAAVEANCQILQAAVEEFAAQNRRGYPVHVLEDTTDTGLTAIDLLPDGKRLVNPFTGEPTEPVDRHAAYPGEVGYEEYGWGGYYAGYTITGCGWDSVIVALTNLYALDDTVRANCYRVREAAEEFARLSCGVYPGDLSDTTPSGDTVIDLLPGGANLANPFTLACTEPVDGAACCEGQTGYVVVAPAGVNVGYVITGAGHDSAGIIIRLANVDSDEEAHLALNCFWVLYVANSFAGHNNGVYPRDIDTDTNLDGDTLLDILTVWIRDEMCMNPYTHEYDQPVDRRASNPGETGYEAVIDGGSVVACIVTGVGAVADSIIIEYDTRVMSCY